MYHEYHIVHPHIVKSPKKCRSTETSDINVNFIQREIVSMVSIGQKCYSKFQSNMRGLYLSCHISASRLYTKHSETKNICQNIKYKQIKTCRHENL